MSEIQHILFLDDDHVMRLTRFALSGEAQVSADWVQAFFSPLSVQPQSIYDLAHGLHPCDGVELYPLETPPKHLPEPAALHPKTQHPAEIIVFRRGVVDAELLAQHPNLKFIQRLGERRDGIDFQAVKARRIQLSCLPRRSLQYTAEHAVMFMLALSKRLQDGDLGVRAAQWDKSKVISTDDVAYNWVALNGLSGLYGKTLGIIGMGEVGALLCKMALAFGMEVLYCNRHRLSAQRELELGASYAPLDALLGASDFVSVNAANLPTNEAMINADIFNKMKSTAYFINTSRGKLIDETALYQSLKDKRIAGAGLDVHWREPRDAHHPLMSLPKVLMTPHYAGGERGEVLHELNEVFENCRRVLKGQSPSHLITD
jgi:phosphoglycerate dehydrogenase-like enzyme